MFCDLADSTALSGRLDAEDFRELILRYQDACTRAIESFDGYVARYLGDGILVYFGYPQAHEDDAERAVRAGLGIIEAVNSLASDVDLAVRVGIATGPVVVGDIIGKGAAQESAVLGETPNLAARLQGVAAPNTVVIAPSTRRLLSALFAYEDLGSRSLKGISEPVQCWRVLATRAAESRFDALHDARLTPLVGREEELDILQRRWKLARQGEGQVVLVSGEAGIGKSRLSRSFREALGDGSVPVLRYQCSPYHTSSMLYPIVHHMERAARFHSDDTASTKLDKLETLLEPSAVDAAQAVPLLATLLSIPLGERYEVVELTPQQMRDRTLAVLMQNLRGIASREPVLVVFEDAHWIDPTTNELLDMLVDAVRDLGVLAIITFRPDFQPTWTGEAHVTLISMTKFSERQCARMIDRVTRGRSLPDEIYRQIIEKTDGVPLFVEELTKTIVESGFLKAERDGYVIEGDLPSIAIPTTLQDSLMARLDRLASARDVAQIGAVIGREFEHELLAAVAALPEVQLDDAVAKLIDSGLVFRRGTPQRTVYVFKHALIQDAAYESLLKSRRQGLHARIANVLTERFPDRADVEPELFARHYTEAGEPGRAVEYWWRAADRAVDVSANQEAIEHASKGLSLIDALPESDDRDRREIALLIELGAGQRVLKGFASLETEKTFSRAWALCERSGDAHQKHAVLRGLFGAAYTGGDLDRSLEFGDRTLQIEGVEPTHLADGHVMRGSVLLWRGDFEEARDELERFLELKDTTTSRAHALVTQMDLRVYASAHLAVALALLGFVDQARRLCDDTVARARSLDQPLALAMALNYASFIRAKLREPTTYAWKELIALCNEYGIVYWHSTAMSQQGLEECMAGNFEAGLALMHSASERYRAIGSELGFPDFMVWAAEAHGMAGQIDEALACIHRGLESAERRREQLSGAELHRLKGDLLLRRGAGHAGEAEDCFERAIDIAAGQAARLYELRATIALARLWQGQGKARQALELLQPIHDWFSEGPDLPDYVDAGNLLTGLRAS